MQTEHIVNLLIQERDRITRAIEALQGPTKRRGRPPKSPLAVVAAGPLNAAPAKAKKRGWTAAQKKAASLRMKARWAKKKKAA
jgi:hypothetical protein